MMNFLKGLFAKKEKIPAVNIPLHELIDWFSDFNYSYTDQASKRISSKYGIIKDSIRASHERTIDLDNGIITGNDEENMLIRENKENFIMATNRFLISIELPQKIDYTTLSDFISRYEDMLSEFNKSTQKSQYILKDRFTSQINHILSQIKVIDENIRDIIDPKLKILEQIKQEVHNLEKKMRLKNLAKEVILSEKQKLEEYEKARKKAQDRMDEIKDTHHYLDLKNLEEEQATFEKEITSLEKNIYEIFSVFQKALRKYSKISVTDDAIIERYATSPISSLMEDNTLKILNILDGMKKSVLSGTLDITESEKPGLIHAIESFDEENLKNKKMMLSEKRYNLDSVKKRITLSVVVQTVKEAEYKFNHNQDKINTLKENIDKLEGIIKGEDIIKLSRYITERIRQNFNIEVKITNLFEEPKYEK